MENDKEMKSISTAFAASYARFVKGYQQYKAGRAGQHPGKEGERYDYSSRTKQSQR